MTQDSTSTELQIRDAQAHVSTDVDNDADVTVLSDDGFHDVDGGKTNDHRFYVEHNHDQGYDVEVYHTYSSDDDWTAEQQVGIVTLAAGQAAGTLTFAGPAGKFRFKTTAPAAAITTGSLTVTRASHG